MSYDGKQYLLRHSVLSPNSTSPHIDHFDSLDTTLLY